MKSGTIHIEIDDAVAVLRFANPPEGFMDDGTEASLATALDRVEGDPRRGAHRRRSRSLHPALRRARARAARAQDGGARHEFRCRSVPYPRPSLLASFRRIETPRSLRLRDQRHGDGGGFELALCCDLRIAQDGPFALGLPEANIGLLPGAGGTQRLPRLVGVARALEIALLGKTVSPAEAARLGLVHESVPDAPARALELARELAAKPAAAIAHVKRLVRGAMAMPLAQGLAQERTLFCDLMVRDEAITRMAEMNAGRRDIRTR